MKKYLFDKLMKLNFNSNTNILSTLFNRDLKYMKKLQQEVNRYKSTRSVTTCNSKDSTVVTRVYSGYDFYLYHFINREHFLVDTCKLQELKIISYLMNTSNNMSIKLNTDTGNIYFFNEMYYLPIKFKTLERISFDKFAEILNNVKGNLYTKDDYLSANTQLTVEDITEYLCYSYILGLNNPDYSDFAQSAIKEFKYKQSYHVETIPSITSTLLDLKINEIKGSNLHNSLNINFSS